MANANQLYDQLQASRLFNDLQICTNVHGFGVGKGATWYVGAICLPEAVRERSEIEEGQAEGYGFMAFAPRLFEDEAVRKLFGDERQDLLTATINLRQRSDVMFHSPKPDIQYRLRQNTDTGLTELEKFYLGEPVDFGVLDSRDKELLREEQAAELLTELPDLPDIASDVDEEDMPRILGAIGAILGRELDQTLTNRENADQLARDLGLTAVFHDEAESLIDFLAMISSGTTT